MIGLIYLIQIILTLLLIFISRKLYDDGDYEDDSFDIDDKIKIPIIAYIGLIIINIIPVLGLGIDLWISWLIIRSLIEEDLYYKPGKIVKFFFKQI